MKYRVKSNIKLNKLASSSSRIGEQGLTPEKSKLSSKNFYRLMKSRGLSKIESQELKKTFDSKSPMYIRHSKAGESFITTHGVEKSSGIFVTKKSLGNTSNERISNGALPHSNTALFETKVELARDQNLIHGKIAPQSKFSKMDPLHRPRLGGHEQIITDGGYNSGAVRNKDTKFPICSNIDFSKKLAKDNENKSSSTSSNKQNIVSVKKGRSR